MQPILMNPEKEQKTLWYVGWTVPFFLGLALWVVLMLTVDKLVFGLIIVGWSILTVPVAVWIPAYYRSLEYTVDSDSVWMKKGVFWKKRVAVPFQKITNVDITQGPVQRMFNIGTIHVQTAGAGGAAGARAELKLLGIRDLEELKDSIMERVRDHAVSKSEEAKEDSADENDSEILKHMLKELTASRTLLEKTQ